MNNSIINNPIVLAVFVADMFWLVIKVNINIKLGKKLLRDQNVCQIINN